MIRKKRKDYVRATKNLSDLCNLLNKDNRSYVIISCNLKPLCLISIRIQGVPQNMKT